MKGATGTSPERKPGFPALQLGESNSEGDAQTVFGRGRISGHGEKCGEWPKFRGDLRSRGVCLYLSQVSNLHRIDCDHNFGGVVNKDGGGCRTCDPGLTFVKREGRKSTTIESLKQI